MIGADDADLAARDVDLPGLALLLDAERVRERLAHGLSDGRVGALRARYLRYKPATSCLVAYRLEVGGTEHDVHALTWRDGEAPRFGKAESRRLAPGPLGPGFLRWDDVPAALWSFPNDLEVRALRRLGDEAERRRLVWRLARRRPELHDAAFELLAYKPGRRCVGLLAVPGGEGAVIKLYSRSAWALRAGVEGRLGGSHRLVVPQLLGRSDRHRAVLLGWIPGATLTDLLRAAEMPEVAVKAAGAALADLHAAPATELPARDPGIGDQGLVALAETMGRLVPARRQSMEALARNLADELRRDLRDHQPVAVHGDLHTKQIVIADRQVGMIDFDRAACSSRAEDIGNLLAHLERDEVVGRLAPGRASETAAVFLDGYRHGGGRLPASAELERQRAAALLRLAMHPFRNREPEWRERVERLLDRVERAARAGGVRA